MSIVGHCPHCGAPIYEVPADHPAGTTMPYRQVPEIRYTCECRKRPWIVPRPVPSVRPLTDWPPWPEIDWTEEELQRGWKITCTTQENANGEAQADGRPAPGAGQGGG